MITRRESIAVLSGSLAVRRLGAEAMPAAHGITRITRSHSLGMTPNTPPRELWHYTVNCPIQIAPNKVMLTATVEQSFRPGQDFLNGNDLIPLDDPHHIDTSKAIPLARTEIVPNPNAGGKPAMLSMGPLWGGFVPLGARRADGSPHPHAGTGFGWNIAAAWPTDDSDLVHEVQRKGRRVYMGAQAYAWNQFYQFAYDGSEFRVLSKQKRNDDEWLSGWHHCSEGFSTGIPDGDDLLLPVTMNRPGRPHCCGVARWKRSDGVWKQNSFQPITPEDYSIEPTLVRDIDGELLFCARARNVDGHPMRVWKSSEQGTRWELVLFVGGISAAPITLHRAFDGTPYIAANRYQYQTRVKGMASIPYFRMPDGKPRRDGGTRETLMLWPINDARTAVEIPIYARDCLAEFGPPPHGTIWAADHAFGNIVQLADGKWHALLGYRVYEKEENTEYTAMTRYSGAYLEEVMSVGKPIPAWNF